MSGVLAVATVIMTVAMSQCYAVIQSKGTLHRDMAVRAIYTRFWIP